MVNVHMVRVFVDEKGKFGDIAPVVIDEGRQISDKERLALARKLQAPETVFVNKVDTADISIMHLQGEVDFAGTSALSVAWLLSKLTDKPVNAMKSRGGSIAVSQNDNLIWLRADLKTMPPWNYKQLKNPQEVESLSLKNTKTWQHTMAWAWNDETKGLIRARSFAVDWDIPEAKANGSGSMKLAAQLNESIEIKHGRGSVIYAKPAPNSCADIGARIIEEPTISL